ncbi:tripartite tricarboxylate transporter TctB family protein [Bifidobacterium choloepi]|uniref:Tripartite tricarboxylate transporter TctB family protein n=1 Tax=Bifidobacterium choloepi TaxID=2614131 RepID=A0A6I5NCI6_9BIFI|nr:tripartite tricarboxylate transporter TctB family protein [Bifidobacterium choloepi]NEG69184.1 tripartite tricarboxylate transporter TctB family protein [Bifidobacterium choloepi]
MPNRAERRAAARKGKGGVPKQYDATKGRARSGMIDETGLQDKSVRIQQKEEEWTPTSSELKAEEVRAMDTDPNDYDPQKVIKAPHSARQVCRIITWCVIVLSAIMFFIVMWLPNHPTWSIITVSAVFAVGVLSLFFDAGDWHNNPNLDQNGTAV